MGTDGFLTAKAIAKRIKAKGLGRLRWYCQMCEKQCRDENGFKCHTKSAGHQRQFALFSENPSEYINRFSDTFRKEFLLVLRQRYGTNFVHASTVYQEYIKDRDHVHMNATKWTTLTAFVKELGKEGHCRVEDREDGWWVAYLARENYEKERRAKELKSHTLESDERAALVLQKQVNKAKEIGGTRKKHTIPEEASVTDTKPLSITLTKKGNAKRKIPDASQNALAVHFTASNENNSPCVNKKRKRSSRWQDLNKIGSEEKAHVREIKTVVKVNEIDSGHKAESDNADRPGSDDDSGIEVPWLHPDITVKITNSELAKGEFFGKKGKVVEVIDGFGARVKLVNSEVVLELDQDDLETVIPKPGGVVYLLRGAHRGKKAVVRSIDIDKFSVRVELLGTGEELSGIEYEAVSRAA
ncbi:DNA/RNA-binding protein KIN17 [Gracilariopsis chorda]|uniref:DNA/RNA-binding protein KIN17 n=1 Tax=Gracilariopsis chorda TaxID=448386 RepID=A0A2V3IPC4_9FLOR|nr:DNA/RNA-binding protein KIN17 [Gracilariopsis chorda]|eukprot:PXF43899.1 DNA/RNA-binding protein KIN17 [Gracilariopsis chorda]